MLNLKGQRKIFCGRYGRLLRPGGVRSRNTIQLAYMNGNRQTITTIIQTRTGSSRLPDKVLMPLHGKPLFLRQVERVQSARLCGTVVIATTTDAGDDVIEDICRREGLEFF